MSNETPATPASSLLTALDELRSPGNVALAALAGVAGLGLIAAGGALASNGNGFIGLLLALFGWLAVQTGYCAVTLRSLRSMAGESPPGVGAAALAGLAAALRMLLALLLLLVALLAVCALAALLFVVTQIPGIGPVLEFVLFPLLALLLGAGLYALLFIAAPLSAVAACEGRSVFGIVATAVLVIRRRLLDTALRGILVGLLALAVAGLAGMIVTMGVGAASGIKGAVAFQSSFDDLDLMMMGGGGFASLLGGFRSAGPSAALLYFLVASLGMVVYAGGWVRIFNDGLRTLDPAALEAQMREQKARLQRAAMDAQAAASARMTRESREQPDRRGRSAQDGREE